MKSLSIVIQVDEFELLIFRLDSCQEFLAINRFDFQSVIPGFHDSSVRPPIADNAIGNLSGGNVQRAVLARELSDDLDVLVIANPCFGLDFGAVAEIHARIMTARNEGAAILLVSEDLDEILELSDRFHVISSGRLVHESTSATADLTIIGQFMAGH